MVMVKNIIRLLVLIELAKSKCHDQANNFQIGKQKVTIWIITDYTEVNNSVEFLMLP